jgi:hypothetical protein
VRRTNSIASADFAPPTMTVDWAAAEALFDHLRHIPVDLETIEDGLGGEYDSQTGLVTAADSAGHSLGVTARDFAVAAGAWVWHEPMWWASSLTSSWPTLSPRERHVVTTKAMTVGVTLGPVIAAACMGQSVAYVCAVGALYIALRDFYGFVMEIEERR